MPGVATILKFGTLIKQYFSGLGKLILIVSEGSWSSFLTLIFNKKKKKKGTIIWRNHQSQDIRYKSVNRSVLIVRLETHASIRAKKFNFWEYCETQGGSRNVLVGSGEVAWTANRSYFSRSFVEGTGRFFWLSSGEGILSSAPFQRCARLSTTSGEPDRWWHRDQLCRT